MAHTQALATEIVAATEMRAFSKVDERQVQTYDETGQACKISDIDLHADFMRAADQSFMPAPAPVTGPDFT